MNKAIKKAKGHNFKKALSLAVGAALLSGQVAPVMAFASAPSPENKLLAQASPQDIQRLQRCLSESGAASLVAENLMMKNFSLTNYEMLVISELIKRDIQKASNSDMKYEALSNLVDLQRKYSDEYKMIFNALPQDIKEEAKVLGEEKKENPMSGKFEASSDFGETGIPSSGSEALANRGAAGYQPQQISEDYINKIAEQYGIKVADPTEAKEDMQNYQNDMAGAMSANGISDAMSLINIKRMPSSGKEGAYEYSNPLNPVLELNQETQFLGDANFDSGIETEDDKYRTRSIQEIIDEAANIEDRKAKHFFLTLAHSLYYLDSGTEGARKLDTTVLDDNGNPYQDAVPDEHEIQQTLEIGLGIRVHKALDLMVSMIAKNEDGFLNEKGTEWEFGNVLFKFHPERLGKAGAKLQGLENVNSLDDLKNLSEEELGKLGLKGLQRLNSEGIIIRDGGQVVGKRIGHESAIVTDTKSGTTELSVGNARLLYDKDEGFQFTDEDSRYYIGFGKMSINLSTYTLQLSDCKAVKVGYHDNSQELMLLYGRPHGLSEASVDEDGNYTPGQYRKDILAAQYIAKNFLPSTTLTFNFARGTDKGELSDPSGVKKRNDSVYGLMIQGNTKNTSYEGEMAHIKTKYTINGMSMQNEANADYLDVTHRFSDKLSAQLHIINVDGDYDASTLVEDKTGDGLKTTTKGDGTPDYLYKAGQRGLDLTLNYNISNTLSLTGGYSNYSLTEDGNSKKEAYISANKQWSLGDAGSVSLQQRFGYNDVSNRSEPNKSSDTTLSYSGSPWKDGSVAADWQRTVDQEQGNQTRYDLSVAHEIRPVERVSITPKISYERKKGTQNNMGTSKPMDTTTLINSLTVGYELVPEELTVNVLVSKEKYNVLASELDESTGKKIDGERRNVFGVGMGLSWEPKKLKGLSLGISYRRDKVDYLDRNDRSNQDVWEYSLEYSHQISNKIQASISYNYSSAKDKIKPIYDDVTRNISVNIDARIGHHSSLQLQHSYESEYKPLDEAANSTTHTTTFSLVNRF